MLTEDDFLRRLAIEADGIRREEPSFDTVDGDLTHWRGFILGTEHYDGGVFVFDVIIPREYPFKPPQVSCLTTIFHPNFFRKKICLGILGQDWHPSADLVDVIESLRFLLSHPNPDDPLHGVAANLMKNNLDEFKKRALEHIERYATWEQLATLIHH